MKDKLISLWKKVVNRETIAYLICGVLTTIINYAVSLLCYYVFHIETITSNTIAWAAAVIFAFFVNKIFVFNSRSWEKKLVWHEFYTFMIARLLSLLFDNIFMKISVDVCHMMFGLAKIVSNVFVMVMNYFASKLISFKKKAD